MAIRKTFTPPPLDGRHPAVASAKRAIRRNLNYLTPRQLFLLAAFTDTVRYNDEYSGRSWLMSADYAAAQEQAQGKGARA
jgi:hypothetical protein